MLKRQSISETRYQDLVHGAKVLKERRGLPAIVLTPDHRIVKHIYARGFWSSSTLWPYYQRFYRNACELAKLGIAGPQIEAVYYYSKFRCDLLMYSHINGESVYAHAKNGNTRYFETVTTFIAKLHDLGVFFQRFTF